MPRPNATIWVVDDDDSIRWVIVEALTELNLTVQDFADGSAVIAALADQQPDLLITDIAMPGESGIEVLRQAKKHYPDLAVVIITAYADLDSTVDAFSEGAFEYLPKPFDIETLQQVVKRALDEPEDTITKSSESSFVGESKAMVDVFRTIARLAKTRVNALVTGETGSGKELVARAIHNHCEQSDGPFIAINTAAIPENLLEAELFGHEKGAFTGADQRHPGRFEQASGGTLFLDEIGDMPLPLQTRLLRVLSEQEFYRVGGRELVTVDVRVIAATHQNLPKLVKQGAFRADLLHRLNIIRIDVPPLRQRRSDIPALAQQFLNQAAEETGQPVRYIDEQGLALMQDYPWSGNVRELKNVCFSLTVLSPGQRIVANDLRKLMQTQAQAESPADWTDQMCQWLDNQAQSGEDDLWALAQQKMEQALITHALNRHDQHRSDAAQWLGIGRNTITRKLKDLES